MGYTIFSDSEAAISRVQHGRCGPAQALAKAVIATVDEMGRRGNTLSIRRTPSHKGIEGNEQADAMARTTAEGKEEKASQGYLQEASLSHLTRKVTEAIYIGGHQGVDKRSRGAETSLQTSAGGKAP